MRHSRSRQRSASESVPGAGRFQGIWRPGFLEKDYALDYLITPALGGADNIQNLWPQPYSSTWNARVKDQLEDHLHELVCQGKVQLATAQNDIASDWIAAYKRYFNTDKPEPSLATADDGPMRELDPSHPNQPRSRISTAYNLALGVSLWQPPANTAVLRAENLMSDAVSGGQVHLDD